MKKSIIFLCGILVLTGCTNKYEKVMGKYAVNYYNSVLKGYEGLTSVTISVKELKKAKNIGIVDFNMKKLSHCSDESYIIASIGDNNEINNITYYMNCK